MSGAPSRPSAYHPASIQQAATEHFYRWELRGRGWAVWDQPIDLEPPFRPFFPFSPVPQPMDDGQREDLFSSVVTGLQRLLGGKRRPPGGDGSEPGLLDYPEPDAKVREEGSGVCEIEVTLPASMKVTHALASQFLTALTYCREPLSFEVIGNGEGITVQLVCREADRYPLREQLSAYFPEASIREREGFLERTWDASGETASALVDFGLSQEFLRPLKTFGGFETDPLIAVVGALSALRPGEVGVLQVLFTPTRHPWAESILQSVMDEAGHPFHGNAPEMVPLARKKIAQPLYAAVFRLAAQSPDEEGAWRIVKGLAGALAQFGSPSVNELAPLTNDHYSDSAHEQDLLQRTTHRTGMILNAEELVSLVHLPSASVRSAKLKRQSTKTKAAPGLALGHKLVLGENEHDGETQEVTLSVDQRVKHVYVIGVPGTGKSTLLLNMIVQDIEAGGGLAVLDPHGDLIDQVLERIPEERYGDVILFDPSDEEYPIGFNILSAHSDIEKHLLSSDLVSVFRRLSTAWGDQMTSVLGNAILSFLESDQGGTLADLRRFLVEKDYRQEFLKTVKDPENVYFWQKEFPLLSGKPQAPLLTRLDTFLRHKLIRHMVAQKENKLDFAEIMNGRKILLAKLAQGAIGEENAYLLGTLLVAKIHQLTLARQEMKAADREPFYLYMDEFHNFVTPSMASILTGARKYRLGLVMAHQDLRQLGKGTEMASAVLSSPYTRMCFRVGDEDARKLAEGFSFFEAKDLQNLGTGEAVCRMERSEFDFNLVTPPMAPVGRTVAEERVRLVTQLSRQRYGTPKAEVEALLNRSAADLRGEEGEEKPPVKSSAEESAGLPKSQVPNAAAQSAESASGASLAEQIPPSMPPAAESAVSYEPRTVDQPRKGRTTGPPAPPTLGRGGQEHKHLQRLIKQWAEGMGWKATIEMPILEGAGSIDVALEKGQRLIACEIGVTTPVEKELGNIEKCLKTGIKDVVSVSTDRKHLENIRIASAKQFSAKELSKVQFLTPDELFTFVEEIDAQSAGQEKRSKGYKVKVNFRAPGKGVRTAKKQDISDAVVDSIETLRRSKGGDR